MAHQAGELSAKTEKRLQDFLWRNLDMIEVWGWFFLGLWRSGWCFGWREGRRIRYSKQRKMRWIDWRDQDAEEGKWDEKGAFFLTWDWYSCTFTYYSLNNHFHNENHIRIHIPATIILRRFPELLRPFGKAACPICGRHGMWWIRAPDW